MSTGLCTFWLGAGAQTTPPTAPISQDQAIVRELTGEPDDKGIFRQLRNVPYANSNIGDQTLDLFLPVPGAKPSALVVYIHGGGWCAGDKKHCPARCLVKHGYAVASINYRLTDRCCFPAQIDDCKAAIRWLRANAAHYNIDPSRIGVWGISAGGHLAALLGTTCGDERLCGEPGKGNAADGVQAVVDWSGPSDFVHFTAKEAKNRYARRAVTKLLGGTPLQKPVLAKVASPIAHAHRGAPPFLIMHGQKDRLVPLVQSQELAKTLQHNGVRVKLVVVPNAGHDVFGPPYMEMVARFFDSQLKPHAG